MPAGLAALAAGGFTLEQLLEFMQSDKGKQMLVLVQGLFSSSGNFKARLGDEAGVWVKVIAQNMQTNYRIVTDEKYEQLKASPNMTAELLSDLDLALQIPEEQELFNVMMIAWLMTIVDKWDKD